ncbi:MAG TPA: hypothetical protein VG225_04195 [Terracidiphilus sp.]|jgi:hypothetical protein|nr:hypothetical protein [Terracidiphilus sp.]
MRLARASVVNLAFSACLTVGLSVLYSIWLFDLSKNSSRMAEACTAVAIMYPCILRFTRSDSGYWKGIFVVLTIIAVSMGFAEAAYYTKMEPIHHDFGESIGFLVFYAGWFEFVAALWYSIAYLLLRVAARMAHQ